MKQIELDLTKHKNETVVLIKFPIDNELGSSVRKIKNARWSASNKAWYVPYSIPILNDIKTIFSPICKIDPSLLKGKIAKYNAECKRPACFNKIKFLSKLCEKYVYELI